MQRSSFLSYVENSKNHKKWHYIAAHCRNVTVLRSNTIFCDFCCFLRMINKKLCWCRGTVRARCQLKSCKMLHKCSTDCIWKGLQLINNVQGHSRSLSLLPFDRICTILLVFHCKYICFLHRFWDINSYLSKNEDVTWPRPRPSKGQFVITKQALLGPIRGQKLTILSLVIPKKFKGV